MKRTYMSGSHLGGSHHIPTVIQDADALRQLRVSHQHHVADVGSGCRGEKAFLPSGVSSPLNPQMLSSKKSNFSFPLSNSEEARRLAEGHCGRPEL